MNTGEVMLHIVNEHDTPRGRKKTPKKLKTAEAETKRASPRPGTCVRLCTAA